MFGGHPNGAMMEIHSCNVEFLEDEFLSIVEVKMDLVFYELQEDNSLSFDEGKNLNTHCVMEDSALPLSGRYCEILVTQENQSGNEVHPQSPIHEHEVNLLVQIPTSSRDCRSDSPPVEDSTHPRDRGRNTSMCQTSIGLILRRSERGRIP